MKLRKTLWVPIVRPLRRGRSRRVLWSNYRYDFQRFWRASPVGKGKGLSRTSLRALITMGYFAHPPLLRQLRLAPLAVETPVCEADLLYPPIGAAPSDIVHTTDDLTPPSDGTPIDIDGPLHPRYSGGAS